MESTENSHTHIVSGQLNTIREATLVLPTSSLGTDYRAAAFPGGALLPAGGILILGTENDPGVAPNVSIQVVGTAVPQTFNVHLNQGDAFQFKAGVDISGSRVTSTRPVVCVCVIDGSAGGHSYEQMFPSRFFGKRYLAQIPCRTTDFASVRVVAHEDATQVTFLKSGAPAESATLNGGQWKNVFTDRFTEIVADKPVLAVHYPLANGVENMVQLVPTAAAKTHFRIFGFYEKGGSNPFEASGVFVAPYQDAKILLNSQETLLANSFEFARDDEKYSFDVLTQTFEFGVPAPTLEYAVDTSRPTLVYSVASGFIAGGQYAHVGGYRFRTSPDLSPSSLTVSAAEVFTNSPVTLKARVRNASLADAANVRIRLFDGDPGNGGIPIGSDHVIAVLAREDEAEVSVSWTPSIPGNRTLTIVVDPMNQILEADEDNNVLSKQVAVRASIDIAGTLKLGGSTFLSNQGVKIDTSVLNASTNASLGILRDGRLEIVVEDAAGNVVARLPSVGMPELGPAPPGLEGWRFFVNAALLSSKTIPGPLIAGGPIDFTKLLQATGAGGTIDLNSVRVVEVVGQSFIERKSYFIPDGGFNPALAASGRVEWVAPGPLVQSAPRSFRVYFDSVESGGKPEVTRLVEPTFVNSGSTAILPITLKGAFALWDRKANLTSQLVEDTSNQFLGVRGSPTIGSMADFNGDGFYDVVRTHRNANFNVVQGAFYLLSSAGANAFVQERPTIWSKFRSDASFLTCRTADVNGDGISDYVVRSFLDRTNPVTGATSQGSHVVSVYLGRGDGTFFMKQEFVAETGFGGNQVERGVRQIDLADVDGDGIVDVILSHGVPPTFGGINNPGRAIRVFKGLGDGTFSTTPITSTFPTFDQPPRFLSSVFVAGDFNEDGNVDLLFPPDSEDFFGRAMLSLGNGNGMFQTPQEASGAGAVLGNGQSLDGLIYAFDYNRDGHLDVVLVAGPFVRVAFGDGTGTFTSNLDVNTGIGSIVTLTGIKAAQVPSTLSELPQSSGAFLKDFLFNTNGLLAGTYRIRMNVVDGLGKLLFTTSSDFEVLSPLQTGSPADITQARILTDKSTYAANETAKLTSTAINTSVNATLTDLTLKVTVSSPSSTLLFTDQKAVASILPGSTSSFDSFFPIGSLTPGTPYTAKLEVLKGGQVIATDSKVFSIAPTFKLTGTLAVVPSTIQEGQPFTLNFTLKNLGNADLTGATARFQVVLSPPGTVLATYTKAVSVAKGATLTDSLGAASTGIPAGIYKVTYQVLVGTQIFPIANATLTVQSAGCPFAKFAILGDTSVELKGQSQTNDIALQKHGDVFSNTQVDLKGQSAVFGNVTSAGGAGSVSKSPNATISGTITIGAVPIALPSPDPAIDGAAIDNNNSRIGLTAKGKNPLSGTAFDLQANDSITLRDGIYFFTSLKVNGTLQMDGLVRIYVSGDVNMDGQALVNQTQGVSSFLLVTRGAGGVSIAGQTKFSGAIYSPTTSLKFAGDTTSKGFFVGKDVTLDGQAVVLRDPAAEALCSFLDR